MLGVFLEMFLPIMMHEGFELMKAKKEQIKSTIPTSSRPSYAGFSDWVNTNEEVQSNISIKKLEWWFDCEIDGKWMFDFNKRLERGDDENEIEEFVLKRYNQKRVFGKIYPSRNLQKTMASMENAWWGSHEGRKTMRHLYQVYQS